VNIFEILDEIEQAYPEDIFLDTTPEERAPIIEQYPGFIDRTSAMMGRHVAEVIRRKLADGAGEEDRLYKAAKAMLDYFDERGPQEFVSRFGTLDILEVCRQIVQEGEGQPHPWPS
jgi:hypothetical protein